MSESPDPEGWVAALRHGLRGLPTPVPSPDFDDRLLAALRGPRPWWQTLWPQARPVLAGAACSALLTLAALSWSLQTPTPALPAVSAAHAAPRPLDMTALDHLLDRPGLSAASLARIETPVPSAPAAPLDGRRPPPLGRRVSRLNGPLVV